METSSYVALYFEVCSAYLKSRPRVFKNRVLRRIFEPRRDEVTGEWRNLHNEELNDLHC